MARCTAPVNGHRSAAAAANCPSCRNRYSGYSRRSVYNFGGQTTGYGSTSGGTRSPSTSSAGSVRAGKPSWSPSNSTVSYTAGEIRTLTPLRRNVERFAGEPSRRDVFLCHAWDDRTGIAKQLNDLLEARAVSVWFSEKDVPLGSRLLREIDKGLANSRIGLVLVTPALLERLRGEGIADMELSELLSRDQLVPIVHNTTYEELRKVSPLLGSRNGLDTAEDSLEIVATKLAELVSV